MSFVHKYIITILTKHKKEKTKPNRIHSMLFTVFILYSVRNVVQNKHTCMCIDKHTYKPWLRFIQLRGRKKK